MKNIFIHGWSFSKDIWRDFFELKNSVFFNLPFHGENTGYPTEHIIENFSNEVAKEIESSEENINLIGWSLGASIAVESLLKTKQDKIKKLILIGFSPKFRDKKLGHNPVLIKAFFVALGIDFKDTIYNFRKLATGKDFKDIPLPEREGSIKLLKEFIDLDLREKLKSISVETVLIHGTEDKIINHEGSKFAKEQIKDSELILVKSHHAPFLRNKSLILKNLKR